MKIYIVEAAEKVNWVMPVDEADEITELLMSFDATSKEENWPRLEFFIFNPKVEVRNFYTIGNSGALVFDKMAYDKCRTFFEMAGEILPIYLEDGTELYLLNVMDCVNALDEKRTKFDLYNDGSRGRILEYAFHKNRYTESTIFKIPHTMCIFTITDERGEEDQFYHFYQNSGLTGLKFELVYDDSK